MANTYVNQCLRGFTCNYPIHAYELVSCPYILQASPCFIWKACALTFLHAAATVVLNAIILLHIAF